MTIAKMSLPAVPDYRRPFHVSLLPDLYRRPFVMLLEQVAGEEMIQFFGEPSRSRAEVEAAVRSRVLADARAELARMSRPDQAREETAYRLVELALAHHYRPRRTEEVARDGSREDRRAADSAPG